MSPIRAVENAFDLSIDLPASGSRRVGRELHRQLRAAILGGRLQSGLRLPSTRDLATTLGVSRNTVVTAYDLLLSEGYVRTAGRGGTQVARFLTTKTRDEPASSRPDTRLNTVWRTPFRLIPTGMPDACRYDFTVGLPDAASFPFEVWRRFSARALRKASKTRAEYGDPQGRVALREAIAGHISFARAIACAPNDVVVTAGAQQAFDLLARILVTPGKTTVAVEEPGYPPLRNALDAAGAKIVSVPIDDEGLQVDRVPPTAKIVCVTPSHQFPLGVHLSLARRTTLLEFARARGAVIIEDDYDGEFRYAGKPLDALKTLDRGACVFYVGTFSKSLFPDLRLGFVIAPPWARPALVGVKQVSDWNAPGSAQDALAAFIAEGHLARHVRKMRKLYGERREVLQRSLQRFCGGSLRVVGIGAGLHLAAYLDPSIRASALIDEAREIGFALDPIQRFAAVDRRADGIVFGYGAIDSKRIGEAVRKLAALLNRGR
jgi:GntR family transcriptional regulator / MocR family aminotransferase